MVDNLMDRDIVIKIHGIIKKNNYEAEKKFRICFTAYTEELPQRLTEILSNLINEFNIVQYLDFEMVSK